MTSEPTTFKSLQLNDWIIRQLLTIGVKEPTPIQSNCIPAILDGKDCIGAAKTGSGKTLAFALPIIQRLCEDPYGIFALILTPTRELAFQIADQFAVIGKPMNLKQLVVVGGCDMMVQGKNLARNPHIVVACPGRLADHIGSCYTFSLKKIKYLVMDEADRLLGGPFDEDIKKIFKELPKKKQSLFFSATITDTLSKLKEVTGNEAFLYEAPSEVATVSKLSQKYVLCSHDARDAYLVQVIRTYRANNENGNIMIFTSSCRTCQEVSIMLNRVGFENVALHAMIKLKERLGALAKFKSNRIKILIATDVAARGLDIPAVELVLNHYMPKLPKEYVHRVGRTARAGRSGKAITLVTPYEIPRLKAVEAFTKVKMGEYRVVEREVGKILSQVVVSRAHASVKLDETNFDESRTTNRRKNWIMQGLDPDEEEAKLLAKRKKKKKKKKWSSEGSDKEEDKHKRKNLSSEESDEDEEELFNTRKMPKRRRKPEDNLD